MTKRRLPLLVALILNASLYAQAPTTLTVSGDIPSSLVINADDFAKRPREKVSIPDQDGTKVEYEGVLLRQILKRAGAPMDNALRGKALASYILATASEGYQVVFTIAEVAPEFADEPILVADKRDGKALFQYRVRSA